MQAVISRVHRIVTTHTGDQTSDQTNLSEDSSGNDSKSPALSPSNPSTSRAASGASTKEQTGRQIGESDATTTQEITVPKTVNLDIQLAVERLQYATLLSERKKSVRALHELAKSYADGEDANQLALGKAAIPVVLNALVSDPRDTELMEAMLEFLQEMVTKGPENASVLLLPMGSDSSGSSSSITAGRPGGGRMFAMRNANATPTSGMQICLQLLQDPSPWIRGPTITLVKCLQEVQQKNFAVAVLECKEGLRRLLEVVEDKREHIRDAALQVLVKLTEGEKNVQQFLAFEDGFVRLFQIMEMEGLMEGSSVISDCLQIVNNMVRDNLMTQTLLCELPYLESHLPRLLRLPSSSSSTNHEEGSRAKSNQNKRALKLGIQLVRFIVSSLYKGVPESKLDELAIRERERKEAVLQQTQSFIARQSNLMGAIGELACCQDEDLADLQLQALDLLQLLVASNGGNQIIFVNLHAKPSHRSVLSELIRLDNAEEETPISAAATSLLDAVFCNNESATMVIFQHINAPPPMVDTERDEDDHQVSISAGRILLDAFIANAEMITRASNSASTASLRSSLVVSWKACHRLVSLLQYSDYCKQLALRIPSQYDDPEARAVPGGLLVTRCIRLIGSSSSSNATQTPEVRSMIFQLKVAVLTLLIHWCHKCPNAVREIIGSIANLTVLVDNMVNEAEMINITARYAAEMTQIRGLVALLLGCCLEYMVDENAQQEQHGLQPERSSVGVQMTREQLLDFVSKRIGLEKFNDALIHFQQSPAVLACSRGSKNHSSRILLTYRAAYDIEEDDDPKDSQTAYLFSLYEKSFTVFYREMAERIQKRIISVYTGTGNGLDGAVSSGAPNPMGAYQDLIRIQDKQIQDLEKELAALKMHQSTDSSLPVNHMEMTDSAAANDKTHNAAAEVRAHFEKQVEEMTNQFEAEKAILKQQIKETNDARVELESRLNGLSIAFEQLEIDFHRQGLQVQASLNASGAPAEIDASGMVVDGGSSANLHPEKLSYSHAEHKLSEEDLARSQLERNFTHEKSQWQLKELRLQKELEDLRMLLEEKSEQLVEANEMLEAINAGQEIVNKENEQLRKEIEAVRADVRTVSDHKEGICDDQASATIVTVQHEAESLHSHQRDFESKLLELFSRDLMEDDRQFELENDKPELADFSSFGETAQQIVHVWHKERTTRQALKTQVEQLTEKNLALEQLVADYDNEMTHLKNELAKRDENQNGDQSKGFAVDGKEREVHQERIPGLEDEISLLQQTNGQNANGVVIDDIIVSHDGQASKDKHHDEADVKHLKLKVATQLAELQDLRALLEKMEALSAHSAKEIEVKDQQIVFLQDLVAGYETQNRNDKQKYKVTVDELENELARAFIDRKEFERKTKASVKELENEVARLFLAKVEMEKRIAEQTNLISNLQNAGITCDSAKKTNKAESSAFESPTKLITHIKRDDEVENGAVGSSLDDMFVLLASLEIHCAVLQESLKEAQGDDAVVAAATLSRQRGALLI